MNVKIVTVQNYFSPANVDYVSPSDVQAFFRSNYCKTDGLLASLVHIVDSTLA